VGDGQSEAGRLYQATAAALATNPTAGAWREVLASAEEVAREYATRDDLGSILALDSTAWEALRNQAAREARTLRVTHDSIADLRDGETVGEGWARDIALRSLQRLFLIMAAWAEGREHMMRALSLIVPDVVQQGQSYVQGAATWWEGNRWWVVPTAGALVLAYVVRSVRR
jgi:hypothetical protein